MHELYYGAYRSERLEHNLSLVDGLLLEVVDFDRDDAWEAGAVHAELAARGTPIGRLASHPMSNGSPGAGVMEVGQVFMHVARYNYLYPSGSLGVAAPAGVDLGAMEGERERERVVRALERSQAYVRSALQGMSAADLSRPTPLYGRQTDGWGVMLQLVAHMNEHLGQSIAYARMNGVVPPWSR
jgi:uncharacterized damage-inducible protein DinB